MRRMSSLRYCALFLSACSFVTDFPDIVGNGGTAGHGGGTVECLDCNNCISPPGGTCPSAIADLFTVKTSISELDAEPGLSSNVEIRDIVETPSGKLWFVGHYVDYVSNGQFVTGNSTSIQAGPGAGFLLDETGAHTLIGQPCLDNPAEGQPPAPGGDEVFFFSAAVVADNNAPGDAPSLVVAGAMEASFVSFFSSPASNNCANPNPLQAPATTTSPFSPFLIWFNAATGAPLVSLTSNGPASNDEGYLSDVAAFPNTTEGKVAAIGVAQENPFTGNNRTTYNRSQTPVLLHR